MARVIPVRKGVFYPDRMKSQREFHRCAPQLQSQVEALGVDIEDALERASAERISVVDAALLLSYEQ